MAASGYRLACCTSPARASSTPTRPSPPASSTARSASTSSPGPSSPSSSCKCPPHPCLCTRAHTRRSVAATRRNIGLIALFFFLTLTFILLAAGKFVASAAANKAGGALGVVTALIAYYVGLAELLVRDESWLTLPLGAMPKRID